MYGTTKNDYQKKAERFLKDYETLKEKGFTMRQIARRCGISESSAYRLLQKKRNENENKEVAEKFPFEKLLGEIERLQKTINEIC